MSKLKIILIILLTVALVLAGIFWYLSYGRGKVGLPVSENQNMINQEPASNVNENINAKPEQAVTTPQISEEEKLKAQLTKMAASFSERYGSYSNQSDYENLEDLLPFMSSSLKLKTENFIREKRASGGDAAIYYGITTKALKSEATEFLPETGTAKFKISTQRQETVGASVNARVFYQEVEMTLIKESGIWKVNEVAWQ